MSHFAFKHFDVHHDRSTMKVGTDGVLLGAWADVSRARRILDIGTGCGLIALMAAQRSAAQVTGIDIHGPSVEQAAANAAASPFASRLHMVRADLAAFRPEAPFDCILSNPPYFEEDLLPPDPVRAAARHTSGLPFTRLVGEAVRLMTPGAQMHVIIPHTARERFTAICATRGLSLTRATEVLTSARKPPRRILLTFVNDPAPADTLTTRLVLTAPDGSRSEAYAALTRDFYL